jgi:ATP-dependent Clp endopeptidase proteolytic subunit ClpP
MITKINADRSLIKDNNFVAPEHILIKDFDADCCSAFSAGFNRLHGLPQSIIPVEIDSYGGDVYSLLGILDIIDASKKQVATFVRSKAMSCGAVLLSAGDKGLRYASSNSTILIHEVSSFSLGKNTDVQSDAQESNRLNDTLLYILAKNSNKPKSFYSDLVAQKNNADLYITPKEALKYGIIDKIGVPTIEMDVVVSYRVS